MLVLFPLISSSKIASNRHITPGGTFETGQGVPFCFFSFPISVLFIVVPEWPDAVVCGVRCPDLVRLFYPAVVFVTRVRESLCVTFSSAFFNCWGFAFAFALTACSVDFLLRWGLLRGLVFIPSFGWCAGVLVPILFRLGFMVRVLLCFPVTFFSCWGAVGGRWGMFGTRNCGAGLLVVFIQVQGKGWAVFCFSLGKTGIVSPYFLLGGMAQVGAGGRIAAVLIHVELEADAAAVVSWSSIP